MLKKWFKCVSLVLFITGISLDYTNAATKKTSDSVRNAKKQLNSQIKQLKQNSEVKEYLSLTKKYAKAIKKSAKQSSETEQMKSRIDELEKNSEVQKFKELQEKKKQFDQKKKQEKAKNSNKNTDNKSKDARLEELEQSAEVQEYLRLQKQKQKEKSKNNLTSSKNEKKNGKIKANNDWRNTIATNNAESSSIIEPVISADKLTKSTLKVEKDIGQAPVKEIETPTLVANAIDPKNADTIEPQQKLFDEKVVFVPQSSNEDVKKKITDISNDLKNYHLVKNVNKQVKNSTELGMELRKDLERYRQVFTNEKLENS